MEDSTLKEFPKESATLSEKPGDSHNGDSSLGEATLRYGAPDENGGSRDLKTANSLIFGKDGTFRGWTIQEQLPTKGAEADLYRVQTEQECCVLKLYRHRLEPKLEVLNRVAEISRKHSRCFVIFRDVGFDEYTGRWYELQEYVPLGSLQDIPPQAKHTPDFLETLVSELAEAIHCLHLNNIIHCDIKPANVLVRSLDPLDLVLTDFGISSILASDMSQKMTGLKGTPMYWAPEAFSRMIGRPCDWWGLGMMVLELLVGKHPLEGLTDSQIIHKLTIGNVEVPDSLEGRWASLVKGLLTKDDALRWGQAEVRRWLSGERDIPVRYEESAIPVKIPFLFEGRDYVTLKELAQAFAVSQNPWFAGVNLLREVRRWLESNMLFDEALELENDIVNLDPERALFRFVHRNAQCPFSLMGKCVDADNLPLFLDRVFHSEAWSAERRIVGMLANGRLLSFYEEYLSLSGGPGKGESREGEPKGDVFFYRLLSFMNKKTPKEQWKYFKAMETPEAYIWPEDGFFSEPGPSKILETLEKMKAAPLKRDAFEELDKSYVLPRRLKPLFRASATYAAGVQWIEDCQIRDLLIPRSFASDSFIYENLSLDEYSRTAQAHWLGQTPGTLEKLDFLIAALPALPCNRLETEILSQTIERLKNLSNQKIAPMDTAFMAEAGVLYKKREEILRRRSAGMPVAAALGGVCFCGLRFLTGNTKGSVLFWAALVLITMVTLALRGASRLTNTPLGRIFLSSDRPAERRDQPMIQAVSRAILGSVLLFFAMIYFGIFSSYPYPFSFLIGGIVGGGIYYGLDRRALSKNAASILEACGSYCVSMTENAGTPKIPAR
ncbi:MAG: protein kinase [Synergistaceae bacterium]|jgi:serine/threonine protein kinase|nr:protein kinase [Synergistaceae bacterium]